MTRCLCAAILAGAVGLPAISGGADPKKEPGPALQALRGVWKQYADQVAELTLRYRKAGTPEEQKKILADANRLKTEFAPRFLELARKHAADPDVIDIVYVLVSLRHADTAAVRSQGVELLFEHHQKTEKLEEIFPSLVDAAHDLPAGSAEKLLRAALEKSPHRAVRGRAAFSLGQYFKSFADTAYQLKQRPALAQSIEDEFGKAALKKVASADPVLLTRQAEDFLQQVVDKYALVRSDRTTLGKAAEAELFEVRHLSYGRMAPDIDGADVDGKRLKLSDYRGKVVVISFWGNW